MIRRMSNYNSSVYIVAKHFPSVLVIEGLGNQLFQFAMAHHIHAISNQKVHLVTPFRPWRIQDRPFALESLATVCPHVSDTIDSRFRFTRALQKLNLEFVKLFKYSIPGIRMRASEKNIRLVPLRLYFKTTFTGFYLEENFSDEVLQQVLGELRQYMTESIISHPVHVPYGVIHVRRGDFDYDRFGRLDLDYFQRAIRKFPDISRVVIVTDSPNEVVDLARELSVNSILGPQELSAWETLQLMSEASFVVGSNSTLSWWGCLLSTSIGGSAVMPNTWFKNDFKPIWFPAKSNIDLIEASWSVKHSS